MKYLIRIPTRVNGNRNGKTNPNINDTYT
jgi:hypothetical protein